MLKKWKEYVSREAARYRQEEWLRYNRRRRERLKTADFTIIASNCSGTFMYRDLGLRYLSPTIGLSIWMKDFVKLSQDLPYYMKQKLVQGDFSFRCPVGFLGDVRINFVHYETFEQAAAKWYQRAGRINWDNLFFVGSDQSGCTRETMRRFAALPHPHKLLFTHVSHPELPCSVYLRGFESRTELGDFTAFQKGFLLRRYMDQFDYIKFLNQDFP